MGVLDQVERGMVRKVGPGGEARCPAHHHLGGDLGRHQESRRDIGDAPDRHHVQGSFVVGQSQFDDAFRAFALDGDVGGGHVPVGTAECHAFGGEAHLL